MSDEQRIVSWMMLIFTNIDTGTVVKKIPYRISYVQSNAKRTTRITVFDTKSFKLKGERKFSGKDKLDPFNFFSVIEIQGFTEGWYDPRKVNSCITPSRKETIMEKYSKYNDWFKWKEDK